VEELLLASLGETVSALRVLENFLRHAECHKVVHWKLDASK
jgi:hypothetical protein